MPRVPSRSSAAVLALAASALLALAGCGSEEAGTATGASSAPAGQSSSGAAAEEGVYDLPDGAAVDTFPVPPGAEAGPGGTTAATDGFQVSGVDPADVLTFYEKTLPDLGYTVQAGSSGTTLRFTGDVSGSVLSAGDGPVTVAFD